MDSDKLIRLLIIDEGLYQAEIITTALRSSGMQVLADHAEDSADMCEIISQKSFDLVLFSLELPDFTLQQVQHLIRECGKHLLIIGIARKVTDEMKLEAMKLGAQDVINSESLELLPLVIHREANNIQTWRRTAKSEKELHESEKRCHSLLANSNDAIAYAHEGMHIYANRAYLELFGYSDFEEDLEGLPLVDMVHNSQQDKIKQFLRDLSQQKSTLNELKLNLLHKSNETIDAILEFSPATFEGEQCTQILIRAQVDTSELEKQITYLNQHDIVTGLFNRQILLQKLQGHIDTAISGKATSTLQMIDIDEFHSIRNTVGISGCDILINDIAKIIKIHATNNELVARFGAHSYCILCSGRDKAELTASSKTLLKKIEDHICEIGTQSITSTCSISIYHMDENSPDNPNEIITRSEKNIDKIQSAGGNDAVVFVPDVSEMTTQEEEGKIASQIKSAITNNKISALYQPIVSIGGDTSERYEISQLISIEDGPALTVDDFHSAAENSGLAKAIDRWSIVSAIKQISDAAKANRKLDIFIPISCDGLQDASLARWIAARIQSSKISGEQLVFLIDESHAVTHLKAAKEMFKGLKELHCQIVLDGFGTGLKPFQLIKHIQADFIRVNRVYMENLSSNKENQKSIREITSQASSMEIRCIIPEVNDASLLSVLWSVGADYVQGEFLQGPSEILSYDFSSMSG